MPDSPPLAIAAPYALRAAAPSMQLNMSFLHDDALCKARIKSAGPFMLYPQHAAACARLCSCKSPAIMAMSQRLRLFAGITKTPTPILAAQQAGGPAWASMCWPWWTDSASSSCRVASPSFGCARQCNNPDCTSETFVSPRKMVSGMGKAQHQQQAFDDPYVRLMHLLHCLAGPGSSQEGSDKGWGNRPFLDLLDVDTGTTKRLWQSSPPFLESSGTLLVDADETVRWCSDTGPAVNCCCPSLDKTRWHLHLRSALSDPAGLMQQSAALADTLMRGAHVRRLEGLQCLITRETQDDQAQYYIKTLTREGAEAQERQLSDFPHPHPTLKGARKEILRYKRSDGVDLTATLYTPPGYDKEQDGPLPCILWAYPREFKSKVQQFFMQSARGPHHARHPRCLVKAFVDRKVNDVGSVDAANDLHQWCSLVQVG